MIACSSIVRGRRRRHGCRGNQKTAVTAGVVAVETSSQLYSMSVTVKRAELVYSKQLS